MTLRWDRLRQMRKQKGLSQEELARRCGCSTIQLYRYEKGTNDPSCAILAALVRELGVSADYLLDVSDDPHGHIGDELTAEHRRLIDAFELGDSRALLEMMTERLKRMSPRG